MLAESDNGTQLEDVERLLAEARRLCRQVRVGLERVERALREREAEPEPCEEGWRRRRAA